MKLKVYAILVLAIVLTLSSCNSSITTDSDKTTQTTQALSESTTVSEKDMAEFEATILALDNEQVFDDNEWNLGKRCLILKYGDYLIFVDYDNVKDISKIYAKRENEDSKIEIYSVSGRASFIPIDNKTFYVSIVANEKMHNVCLDLISGKTSEFKYDFEQSDELLSYSPIWTKASIIFEGDKSASPYPHSPLAYLYIRDKNSNDDFTELSCNWGWSYYQNKIYFTDGDNSVSIYENDTKIKNINLNFNIEGIGSIYGNIIIGNNVLEDNKLFIFNLDSNKDVYTNIKIDLLERNGTTAVYKNYVYCMDTKGILYGINTQTGETQLILDKIVAENISFIDDWVYFNDTTSRYSFESGEAELVSNDHTIKLCRMKLDGSQIEVL